MIHENARSDQLYLPETMGSRCAFLDYDDDGWMDIVLVHSGPSDFWTPLKPVRNALYKNNRDGTFTDLTGKAGGRGRSFGNRWKSKSRGKLFYRLVEQAVTTPAVPCRQLVPVEESASLAKP